MTIPCHRSTNRRLRLPLRFHLVSASLNASGVHPGPGATLVAKHTMRRQYSPSVQRNTMALKKHGDILRETRRLPDGRGGTVSAAIASPDGFTAGRVPGVILAHGAGNDMTNPLLV